MNSAGKEVGDSNKREVKRKEADIQAFPRSCCLREHGLPRVLFSQGSGDDQEGPKRYGTGAVDHGGETNAQSIDC